MPVEAANMCAVRSVFRVGLIANTVVHVSQAPLLHDVDRGMRHAVIDPSVVSAEDCASSLSIWPA